MGQPSSKPSLVAISSAADFRRQRQHLAEPLWFALLCRELWGANAPKELQFITGRSDRTCRAWASGDSEPPAGILVTLLGSEHGPPILTKLMHDSSAQWWRGLMGAKQSLAQF